jgi:hypothetical protein
MARQTNPKLLADFFNKIVTVAEIGEFKLCRLTLG